MDRMDELFEDAVAAFRRRLNDALARMRSSRDAKSFCEAERELVDLAKELASVSLGAALPLSWTSPRQTSGKPAPAARAVRSPIRTVVPCSLLSCSRRAATLTASPITVYSSRSADPMSPARTSPVLMPMRVSSRCPRNVLAAVTRSISSAARMALAA